MTIALLCVAGFVLYPMFVGLSHRFLGRHDKLGIIKWLGYATCCPEHRESIDTDGWCRHKKGLHACGFVDSDKRVRLLNADKRWAFSAVAPLTWAIVLTCYLVYWFLWTPLRVLAHVTAKTAQLTAGDDDVGT